MHLKICSHSGGGETIARGSAAPSPLPKTACCALGDQPISSPQQFPGPVLNESNPQLRLPDSLPVSRGHPRANVSRALLPPPQPTRLTSGFSWSLDSTPSLTPSLPFSGMRSKLPKASGMWGLSGPLWEGIRRVEGHRTSQDSGGQEPATLPLPTFVHL